MLTKSDEKRLILVERKILRKIFGPKRKEEENTYEQRTNVELKTIFNKSDLVGILKSRISWVGTSAKYYVRSQYENQT